MRFKRTVYILTYTITILLGTSCGGDPTNNTGLTENERKIKAELIDLPENYPSCGILKNLVGFKFEYVNDKKVVVFLIPCPELKGKNFFIKNRLYQVEFENNNGKDFNIINKFSHDSLETFIVSNIEKVL
jgi:hypothetical protein